MCRHRNGRVSTAAIAFGRTGSKPKRCLKVGKWPNEFNSQHLGLVQAQKSSNQASASKVSTGSTDYRPWLPSCFLVSYRPLGVAAH